MRLYWAAGFFDEAQSAFNLKCASRLRAAGHSVFLPQELDLNDPNAEPDSVAIFRADEAELASSDALIAVIDGEAIDSGVATEIGLAASLNKGVFGLLTDLRANRTGEGRIYRNLFTIGLLRESGGLYRSMDELIDQLDTRDQNETIQPEVADADIEGFLNRLESLYEPPWSVFSEVTAYAKCTSGAVIDFGCGVGAQLRAIRDAGASNHYFGIDIDQSRLAAIDPSLLSEGLAMVGTPDEAFPAALDAPELLVMSFVLHELETARDTVRDTIDRFKPQSVIAHDLSTSDLPRLSEVLLELFPADVGPVDNRRAIEDLPEWLTEAGYHVTSIGRISLEVTFETAGDLTSYIESFDLLSGGDMPVGDASSPSRIWAAVARFEFPWTDKREFRRVIAVRPDIR